VIDAVMVTYVLYTHACPIRARMSYSRTYVLHTHVYPPPLYTAHDDGRMMVHEVGDIAMRLVWK